VNDPGTILVYTCRGAVGKVEMGGLQTDRLSVEAAATEAGVSVDTIRRAYRSGALRAFRPGGTRRIVIRREDLQAWAFGDEHLVAGALGGQLRPVAGEPVVTSRRAARPRSRRSAVVGSVERLRQMERSG
jgi:excisionase family DNA binding protein